MTTSLQPDSIHQAFISQYPEEVAYICETHPTEEVLRMFQGLSGQEVAQTLSAMTPSLAAEILQSMPRDMMLHAIPQTRPSLAATLLKRLSEETRRTMLETLPQSVSTEIQAFLEYPEDSVGLLMDSNFFALPQDLCVEEAIGQVRTHASHDLHEIYIIDRAQTLVGILPLRDMFLASPQQTLQSLMKSDMPTIHPLESQEQVLEVFDQWKVLTIPVTDLNGQLLGVIRNQDIIEIEKEEATSSLQTMVGASKDERALSPPLFAVRKRLPWLQINLLTAFLAAFVVGLFEGTIAKYTALAILLPVVAGQSGNTGAQALAVVMRGLALRDIRPTQWMRVATKESYVALINGVAVAATTSAAVYVWSRSGGLTMVIGVSMVLPMVMAGFSGAVIPIILRALNQDPAQSSSIILTTVTDVAGFMSFLGLATLFSSYLD